MMRFVGIKDLLSERRAGHSLPQQFYTSDAIFDFDMRSIFATSWLFAGFEAELPKPGSYVSFNVGSSPILILRDNDNTIRGFFNSCRHRGSRICRTGTGTVRTLVCPYHQWNYDLNGELKSAREMQAGFDPAQHALRPVNVRTAAGVIYVCLSEAPPEFDGFKKAIEPLLAPHKLYDTKVAFECQLVEQANWKLVMENARECYHCNACHPSLINSINVRASGAPHGDATHRARFDERMADNGLFVGPVMGNWWDASRNPLKSGTQSITLDGKFAVQKKICTIADGDVGTMRWGIEPNFFAHALGDYLFAFSAMPTGARETVVTCKWLVHKDAREGVDYDLQTLTEVWDATNREDRDLSENNQIGVNSIGYLPGPYNAAHESYVVRFTDWYCNKVAEYLARKTS